MKPPKQKTILLQSWQAAALAEGRLTRIVLPVKRQPDGETVKPTDDWNGLIVQVLSGDWFAMLPPYAPGDVLACKETWCQKMNDNDQLVYNAEGNLDPSCYHYKADGIEVMKCDDDGGFSFRKDGWESSPWISPVRMPPWAVRFRLSVKAVECKRVSEITESEAMQCGFNPATINGVGNARSMFRDWWRVKHGKKFPWASNPWASSPWAWNIGVETA